jgi:lipid-A-disaccharide synthase
MTQGGPELLVVAAEASADLHGAAVLKELRELVPGLRAFGAAGPRMRAEGCEALVRAEDLSVMGIAEVLPALPRVLDAMDALADAALERRPRVALLIDSPDFNLRLAARLRRAGTRVVYFIGPSVWAWRTYRVRQIARDVSRMLVILPFEAAFYARHGVRATYVGNPVADAHRALPARADRSALRRELGLAPDAPVLALLPGSRRQELARLWAPLLGAARELLRAHPGLQIAVPVAPTVDRAWLDAGEVPIHFLEGRAPDLLSAADAAVVASGTATLEAALALVPTVVVYRLSWLSWLVGRLLVRVKFVSLINLLAGRALVPELLQRKCTAASIAAHVEPLLSDGGDRDAQLLGMRALREELAPPGSPHAARRAAQELAAALAEAP